MVWGGMQAKTQSVFSVGRQASIYNKSHFFRKDKLFTTKTRRHEEKSRVKRKQTKEQEKKKIKPPRHEGTKKSQGLKEKKQEKNRPGKPGVRSNQ